MNIIAAIHFIAAMVATLAAIPLIQRKVKVNQWYGFRMSAALASDDAWLDINHYGGRLLFIWAMTIAITAAIGLALGKKHLEAYCWTSLVIIVGGLAIIAWRVFSYSEKRKRASP